MVDLVENGEATRRRISGPHPPPRPAGGGDDAEEAEDLRQAASALSGAEAGQGGVRDLGAAEAGRIGRRRSLPARRHHAPPAGQGPEVALAATEQHLVRHGCGVPGAGGPRDGGSDGTVHGRLRHGSVESAATPGQALVAALQRQAANADVTRRACHGRLVEACAATVPPAGCSYHP
nr:unnamed protein product [Digitaria exilis]